MKKIKIKNIISSDFNKIWEDIKLNDLNTTLVLDLDEVCYQAIIVPNIITPDDYLINLANRGFYNSNLSLYTYKANNIDYILITLFRDDVFNKLCEIWNNKKVEIVLYSNGSRDLVRISAKRMLNIIKSRMEISHRDNWSQIIHRHSAQRNGFIKRIKDIHPLILKQTERMVIIDDSLNIMWKLTKEYKFQIDGYNTLKWNVWGLLLKNGKLNRLITKMSLALKIHQIVNHLEKESGKLEEIWEKMENPKKLKIDKSINLKSKNL